MMFRPNRLLALAAIAGFVGGCAHLPDVTVNYYLARSKVSFKVIRTVACDAGDNPIVANSATPVVVHTADQDQPVVVGVAGLKGPFSDSDVKFDFYEDGRLKSLNSTGTGQGEAILKTVVSIATAAFAMDAAGHKTYPKECAFIKNVGAGKPLTLTYDGEVDLSASGDEQDIPPDVASGVYAALLQDAIGGVCAVVGETERPKPPVTFAPNANYVLLKARQPALVSISVMAGPIGGCASDVLWDGRLPAAQFGTDFSLPLPPAPVFGKQVFAASFAESGALASIQYASNTGVGQVLNVVNSGLTSLQGETTAQKVAEVKAQADLIAQQQRLVQCLADQTTCK